MTGNKLCKPAQRSVTSRANRFEWRSDLPLTTQSSPGNESKDTKENFEKYVTW